MPVFPLPPVPNFRVAQGSPGFVRLNWADYPLGIKEGHALVGFRIYRSSTKDELGELIADEKILGPNAFQFDDTDPLAGPGRFYVVVAAEEGGSGEVPFGNSAYGGPDTTGFSFPPYSQRPFGSPLKGYGQAFDVEAYGF